MSEPEKHNPEELLKGLFHNLQGVVQSAQDLAVAGANQLRRGVFPRGTGLHGVYGFTVRTDLSRPSMSIEPFGNIRPNAAGQPVVQEYSEPRTEMTEELELFLLVAEVPGVAAEDVKLDVTGNSLTITAERGGRKYRKEVTLPEAADFNHIFHACHDGLLEVRVPKAKISVS